MLIGSFLNVVALRYNSGMTLKGRSKCFSCGKNLDWNELIPVFSFIFQKGKCVGCKSKISWQYPVIEMVAGVLFTLIFLKFPPISILEAFTTVFYIFITSILLVITIYDIKHKIIPDSLVYTFIIVCFIRLFVSLDTVLGVSLIVPNFWDLLSGPILALPFAMMWLVSGGTWMGLGDAKLVLGMGWLLGLVYGVSAIFLAFWIGASVSIIWMLIVFKKVKSRYEIPFGPYLILGMYIVIFSGLKVIELNF